MKRLSILSLFFTVLFAANAMTDSISDSLDWASQRELQLNELVVVAKRPVLQQREGKIVYLVKNDPYCTGMDGLTLLGRIPRVNLNNGTVSVPGKNEIRYIIDGVLIELDDAATKARLKSLTAENIEKIELLTSPPARYAVEGNAAYISITTRDERLGTRGNVYASLSVRNKLSQYFSGNISHSTRKIEMSVSANVSNDHFSSDNDQTYVFTDNERRSSTHTDSHDIGAGINALLRYKVNTAMNFGLIANYSYGNFESDARNNTQYGFDTSTSSTETKSRPNNAITITGFYDWAFGKSGETMQLTYNYFNRHSPTSSQVATVYESTSGHPQSIAERGAADYIFHSAKADFSLPYSWMKIDAGAAYTDIDNSSSLHIGDGYSTFDYREKIAAVYLEASRKFGAGFFGKIGLRYEHTTSESILLESGEKNRSSYGHVFPTANLSWNKDKIGSFNLNYSMGMRRPNLWDINPYRYYSTVDEYFAGNPNLKPTLFNNAEINYYGLGGLYAVLYTSFASDAIGFVQTFDDAGVKSSTPYNCVSTNKTGLYANYRHNVFDWWEMSVGGEVFYSCSRATSPFYGVDRTADWSGKIEVNGNWMLNKPRTLTFNARFSHFFPWQQDMFRYRSMQILSLTLRYSLLGKRLNLRLSANEPFNWNKSRSTAMMNGFTLKQVYNPHSASVILSIAYNFGRDKVATVWRDPKESQSTRSK